jgi:hypothetical protein
VQLKPVEVTVEFDAQELYSHKKEDLINSEMNGRELSVEVFSLTHQ